MKDVRKKGYGLHPDYLWNQKKCWKGVSEGKHAMITGERVHIEEFFNPLHSDVYLIPQDSYIAVVDSWGDNLALDTLSLPFSSTGFYFDNEKENIFSELYHDKTFWRLGGIRQLGYLVPPCPIELSHFEQIYYVMPAFPHNRYQHSLLVALMSEVLLARLGFSHEERIPIVLAFACHDIAMPAGGDSVIRIDRKRLSEEKNFSQVMTHSGLAGRWQERYGFDLELAQRWVENEGMFGELLNYLDRISYVLLDCYHTGIQRGSRIDKIAFQDRLIGDVWEDIRMTPDRSKFYFVSPRKLYNFLLLRAYEHSELLVNPYSRVMDHTLYRRVNNLLQKGKVTINELLQFEDKWLENKLIEEGELPNSALLTPDIFGWKKFCEKDEAQKMAEEKNDKLLYIEYIKKFDSSLDWPVSWGKGIVALRQTLSKAQIDRIESIFNNLSSHYVYYLK